MSAMLFALGRWAYRARVAVLVGWIAVLALGLGGAAAIGIGTNNSYQFPGTESQEALDALARTFPQFSGTSAQLIAVAPPGGDVTGARFQDAVEDSIADIGDIDQVAGVSDPYGSTTTGDVAPDDSAVLVSIQLTVQVPDVKPSTANALQRAGRQLQSNLPDGSQVAVGGQLYSQADPGIGVSEVTSLGIAYVILAVTFLSLIAAGMPLATATLGVGVAVAIVFAATRFITVTSTAPLLAVMLGLAVGVDYALFVISRHQDQLRRGMAPEESAPRAIATAGSAVAFAATTVIIALLGLAVARIPFLTVTGVAAALGVASAALVALTLTPALLGFAGWHAVRRRDRPVPVSEGDDAAEDGDGEEEDPASAAEDDGVEAERDDAEPEEPPEPVPEPAEAPVDGVFGRWVRLVTAWPPVTVLVVVALLGLAAVPALGLRLALPDAGSLPEGEPGRTAYDLVAEHFGPGYNGPLLLTGSVIQSTDPVTLVDDLADEVAAVPGVASIALATPNQTGDTAIIQAIPAGAPDSVRTEEVVQALRALAPEWLEEYAVDLAVTGYTAVGIDISDRLGGALAPFALLVVGLSLVLLAMVFRSIVVPITAALGYLLSIGAAFGATALVFMDGHLTGLLQVSHVGSIISFMPIIVMGVLFGLAMDYEVFLVSRMRESYIERPEPRRAVRHGFVGSARVVTAAAIIMTAVFGGFVRGGEASIQPIALGLAVGVATDAFVVRMTLIPAVLAWFGRATWWFPAALDRALPHFDIEGQGLAEEDALADWPEPGDRLAIALEGARVPGMPEDAPALEARVPAGGVLLVEGGSGAERTAVLLALAGRSPLATGRAKVAGLVLPVRAATVRRRAGYVALAGAEDPAGRVHDATAITGTAVLALDGADAVRDAGLRAELLDVLDRARAAVEPGAAALTLVCASERAFDVEGLVPDGAEVTVLSLEPAAALAEAGP